MLPLQAALTWYDSGADLSALNDWFLVEFQEDLVAGCSPPIRKGLIQALTNGTINSGIGGGQYFSFVQHDSGSSSTPQGFYVGSDSAGNLLVGSRISSIDPMPLKVFNLA